MITIIVSACDTAADWSERVTFFLSPTTIITTNITINTPATTYTTTNTMAQYQVCSYGLKLQMHSNYSSTL